MKDKIIYVAVFGGSFVVITLIFILLNNDFRNIYAFDFTSNKPNQEVQSHINEFNYKETYDQMFKDLKSQLLDSVKFATIVSNDTIKDRRMDSILTDSINNLKSRLGNLTSHDTPIKPELLIKDAGKDSTYRTWTKKTASLYEAMDSKKAAKIIQNYSDNVARDILYSMKKKKAAEVLANLNPETANRMTRMQ